MLFVRRSSAAIALWLGLIGCSRSPAPGAPPNGPTLGHLRMLATLKGISERTAEENHVLGDKALRSLTAQFQALRPDAPLTSKWDLNRQIGLEQLRIGKTDEAIAHLGLACSLLPELGGQIQGRDANNTVFQLALAYMRLAETRNCVAHHTTESCLFPIAGGGIHVEPEASTKAIEIFTSLLKVDPTHTSARWLLNIAYMTIGGYPDRVPRELLIPPATFASEESFPRFPDVAARAGLRIFNLSGGAIAEDFDGDSDLDVVTSSFDTAGPMRYFRNEGGGTFTERTAEAGLTGLVGGLNMVQADYDNDGNTDILVLRGAWLGAAGQHPNSLLRNLGGGTFSDVTYEAGLGEVSYPTQTASWGDYDNDGHLDLYIGNETGPTLRAPCQLFHNNGNGTFSDRASEAGVENFRFTKGVIWGDYDGDGLPDLYVSNLGEENRLFHNDGRGKFTDVAGKLGVTRPIRSFPVWFWDFDNDGNLDLFVSSYWPPLHHVASSYLGIPTEAEHACLYQGDGHGGFRDVAQEKNLRRVTLPMGSNFGDLDNDGFPDFYLGTGYPGYEGLMPNVMYHNQGGRRFADVTTAGGFGHLQKGHGVAFADLDADGDQDVFIELGGAYPGDGFWNALFENPGFGRNWLKVKLVGTRSNRSAIGARVRVEITEDGRRRSIYSYVNSGGSFGANPLRREIGLGTASKADTVEVTWPTSGTRQVFSDVQAGRLIEITEGRDAYSVLPLTGK